MDIDSNTPPVGKANSPRSGVQTAPTSPQERNSQRGMPNGSATAPTSATEVRPPDVGLSGLSSLAATEPFLPTTNGNGLSGMNDLKSDLPFKSRASDSYPTDANASSTLKYPEVPVPPTLASKFTITTGADYLSNMDQYVKEYCKYNKVMLNHFRARQENLESDMEKTVCETRGASAKGIGFAQYYKMMKQDEGAMIAWQLAQSRHVQALGKCEEVRNKVKRLVEAQG